MAAVRSCGIKARQIAMKDFMSEVPRPKRVSPLRVRVNGSVTQGWPSTGTTSVWPDRIMPPCGFGAYAGEEVALFTIRRGDAGAGDFFGSEDGLDVFDNG